MLSKCLTPFFCSYTVCTPNQLFDAGMRKGTQAEKGAFQTVLLGESGYAGKIGNQLAICVIGFLQLSLSSLCKTDGDVIVNAAIIADITHTLHTPMLEWPETAPLY